MSNIRSRLTLTLGLVLAAATLVPADDEPEKFALPPRLVKLEMPNSTLQKVATAIVKQTGLPFTYPPTAAGETCDGIFNGVPYWDVLERIADQTGNRISLSDHGRTITLVSRGKSREVSSVFGPFRVVAERVTARSLLEDNTALYEVGLLAHWEPHVPVFRIDSQPKITEATDDRDAPLTAHQSGGRTRPTGAAHPATIRLTGLTRAAKRIDTVRGEFTVTASEKMLSFSFSDLTAQAPAVKQNAVTAVLAQVEKDEQTWELTLRLTYPPNLPRYESFEQGEWATGNRLRLIAPDGSRTFTPDNHELDVRGSQVTAVYRFKENASRGLANIRAKGWTVVYEAPSPPMEVKVPFELKDIPLP